MKANGDIISIRVDFDPSADQNYIYTKYKITKSDVDERNDKATFTGTRHDLLKYLKEEYFHGHSEEKFLELLEDEFPGLKMDDDTITFEVLNGLLKEYNVKEDYYMIDSYKRLNKIKLTGISLEYDWTEYRLNIAYSEYPGISKGNKTFLENHKYSPSSFLFKDKELAERELNILKLQDKKRELEKAEKNISKIKQEIESLTYYK